MSWNSKFHLVDDSGEPLGDRFQQIAKKHERQLFAASRKLGYDDAVLCDCVERTAVKVHAHEKKYGPVEDLGSYFLRAFWNEIKKLLRGGNHHTTRERSRTDKELELQAGATLTNSAEAIERHITIEQVFRRLDVKKQKMLWFDGYGHSTKDIAKCFGTTEGNVNTILHRAREEAKKSCRIQLLNKRY